MSDQVLDNLLNRHRIKNLDVSSITGWCSTHQLGYSIDYGNQQEYELEREIFIKSFPNRWEGEQAWVKTSPSFESWVKRKQPLMSYVNDLISDMNFLKQAYLVAVEKINELTEVVNTLQYDK